MRKSHCRPGVRVCIISFAIDIVSPVGVVGLCVHRIGVCQELSQPLKRIKQLLPAVIFCVRSVVDVFTVLPIFMADIEPFAALRPKPDLAARICELPYDVLSSAEAREQAERQSAELFPRQQTGNRSAGGHRPVFAARFMPRAKKISTSSFAEGSLQQDAQPYYYLYRQVMGKHSQIGFVAAASCEDYLKNIIKKHEFTRPDKEDDRVRHIETLNSQTGPVFLTYKAAAAFDEYRGENHRRNRRIRISRRRMACVILRGRCATPTTINSFAANSPKCPSLYIADGHHRSAAAGSGFQVAQRRRAQWTFSHASFSRITRCRSCPTTAC